MDYSFIKDVKVIDEHTIEFDTRVIVKNIVPKRFKRPKDSNCTYYVYTGREFKLYVNGVFVEKVYRVDYVPIPIPFDDRNYKQEIFRLRITFV